MKTDMINRRIAKPIFIFRFPNTTGQYELDNAVEHIKATNPKLLEDYHVIYVRGKNTDLEFECYNANSIPIEEQKRTKGLIIDIISNNKLT